MSCPTGTRKAALPAIYEAYQLLQYGEYSRCAASTEDILRLDRANQQAFLLRLQCSIESSYLDETELDTIGIIDATRNLSFQNPGGAGLQQHPKENAAEKNEPTHINISQAPALTKRIETGFVRPATNAAGKPLTRGTSRLMSSSRTGSRMGSRAGSQVGSRANSKAGSRSSTAAVAAAVGKGFASNMLSSHLELRTASLCSLIQEFPISFISHRNYSRILIAYMTRILPTKLDYLVLDGDNSVASRSDASNNNISVPPEHADTALVPRHALFFLSRVMASNCSDWLYNDRKGRVYFAMGCYDESEKYFRSALKESPKISTYLKLASTLAAKGHINSGILVLRECAERFQTNAAPHLAMARLYELTQNYGQCACSYADALERNPSNMEALASLASLLVQGVGMGAKNLGKKVLYTLESPSSALILYKRILLFNPADPAVWNNLGVCHIERHQYNDAFIHLLTALNRLELARRELNFSDDRIIRIHSDIWFNIGTCFLHLSDMAAAKNCFNIVHKIDCTHIEALVNLAVLLVIGGQGGDTNAAYIRALALLNYALEINPLHTDALYNRMIIYRRIGNIEKALLDAVLVAPDVAFEMERELC